MVVSMLPHLRSRTAIGIGLTLLLHLAVLLCALYVVPVKPPQERMAEYNPDALTVQLLPNSAPAARPAPTPAPSPPPSVPAPAVKPAPRPAVKPAPAKPRVSKPAPAPRPTTQLAQRQAPLPPVTMQMPAQAPRSEPKAVEEAQPTDMMGMVNAARERRRAAGIPADPPPAERSDPAPAGNGETRAADNSVALANIQHSMRTQGSRRNAAGGAFQITHKGIRQATFIFRGWASNRSANLNQSIEVDAGPGGDIETAIVKSMIELIRKYQPGDFSWDSYRLGRVLTLSARPEDSAQLEKFLKQEFFSGY
ncbi:MAG: hypothetical protein ACRYGK_01750 [Janthinobacterium lividum]